MRLIAALLLTVALVTPAQANHIAGHYGGVPMVQPAPLPWQRPAPPPPPQPYWPPMYMPMQPYPGSLPRQRPAPPLGPNQPPRRGPNVCDAINCD